MDRRVLYVMILMVILWMVIGIMLVWSVGAQTEQSLGTFDLGDNVTLIQNCGECSYVNISVIRDPDGEDVYRNLSMGKDGSLFLYDFNSSDFRKLGRYIVAGFGDAEEDSEEMVAFAYHFDIVKPFENPFSINFNNYTGFVLLGFMLLFGVALMIFRMKLWAGLVFFLVGMMMLINELNIVMSLLIAFVGAIISFFGK